LSPRHFAENARRKIDVARFFSIIYKMALAMHTRYSGNAGFRIQQSMISCAKEATNDFCIVHPDYRRGLCQQLRQSPRGGFDQC
jgi:hypothetical protein